MHMGSHHLLCFVRICIEQFASKGVSPLCLRSLLRYPISLVDFLDRLPQLGLLARLRLRLLRGRDGIPDVPVRQRVLEGAVANAIPTIQRRAEGTEGQQGSVTSELVPFVCRGETTTAVSTMPFLSQSIAASTCAGVPLD
jgi:hypothetical protein